MSANECFISVDIEASGPVPGLFSMLSLGACLCDDQSAAFEVILRPVTTRYVPKALEVTGFDLNQLERDGCDPAEALAAFSDWVIESAAERTPVFVGLNAAFDWAFINYYFHLFEIPNPFGIAPVDIKSLYMGRFQTSWKEATSKRIAAALSVSVSGDHTALTDAIAQAELFRAVRGTSTFGAK